MSIFAHRNVFADQPSPAFLIQDPIAEHILEFDFSTQTFNWQFYVYGIFTLSLINCCVENELKEPKK